MEARENASEEMNGQHAWNQKPLDESALLHDTKEDSALEDVPYRRGQPLEGSYWNIAQQFTFGCLKVALLQDGTRDRDDLHL